MKKSSGLLIIKDNKILLCHPTNSSWKNTYSIPKGQIEKNESKIDAAIRETKEEVGIIIPEHLINKKEYVIDYEDKNGKIYKKVFYFLVELDNNYNDIIPKEQLQLEEVDHAEFLTKEEAKNKIFWRFNPMLDFLKEI